MEQMKIIAIGVAAVAVVAIVIVAIVLMGGGGGKGIVETGTAEAQAQGFTISFNSHGGIGTMENVVKNSPDDTGDGYRMYMLPDCEFTKTEDGFVTWGVIPDDPYLYDGADEADSTMVAGYDGQMNCYLIVYDDDITSVTLYAIWGSDLE